MFERNGDMFFHITVDLVRIFHFIIIRHTVLNYDCYISPNADALLNVAGTIITTAIVIDACHYSTTQVTLQNKEFVCFSIEHEKGKTQSVNYFTIFRVLQKIDLVKNIEKLTFWAGNNEKLYIAKQELLSQINSLNICISGNGFFIVNRQLLAGVRFWCFVFAVGEIFIYYTYRYCFNSQMAAACCTYITIFIQFYLTGK